VFPSDLPGVNPATLNGMILYYRLMIKRSGLGDSTELSRVGLSHPRKEKRVQPAQSMSLSLLQKPTRVAKFTINSSHTTDYSLVSTQTRSPELNIVK
jgi:hypothetical protein